MNLYKKCFIPLIVLIFSSGIIFAESMKAIVVGKYGDVSVLKDGQGDWRFLNNRSILHENDVIKTGEGAYVYIKFPDNPQRNYKFPGSAIRIGENSIIAIKKAQHIKGGNRDIEINMPTGSFLGKIPPKFSNKFQNETSKFELETPVAVCGVSGEYADGRVTNRLGFRLPFKGYMGQLAYDMTDRFTLLTRYGWYDQEENIKPKEDRQSWTYGINYLISPQAILKLEYRRNDEGPGLANKRYREGTGQQIGLGTVNSSTVIRDAGGEDDNDQLGASFIVVF